MAWPERPRIQHSPFVRGLMRTSEHGFKQRHSVQDLTLSQPRVVEIPEKNNVKQSMTALHNSINLTV